MPIGKALQRQNLVGGLWMIIAMACFAVEDVFVKAASSSVPVSFVLIIFGAGGALLFAGAAISRGESLFNKQVVSRPMLIRAVFEMLGRLFYVLAIAYTPLSSVTAILQTTPIIVVAGAALIFRERVGWQRWTAIIVGMVGVLFIIRPATDSFSILSVLAVIGTMGFAGRDLASRAAPASLSTSMLGLYGFLAILAAGVLFSIWEGAQFAWPGISVMMLIIAAVFCGVVAYVGLMKAMRTGEVSAVTPFRYCRILFGISFGVMLFDEKLDTAMLTGCGLIVASGLYIMLLSKRLGRVA